MSFTESPFISDSDLNPFATKTEDLSPKFQVRSERFSTNGLAVQERVEKWEDHNAKALVGLGARTINDSSLEATEINLHLPTLHFAHVEANPHIIERTTAHIRSTPADSVVLYFSLYGESFFYHKDGVRTLSPGSVLVYDTDRPFMRGFAKGLKELVLMVPRDAFTAIAEGELPSGGEPQVLNFGKSTKANDFATNIADIMAGALNEPERESLATIEDTVFDLLRGIFGGTGAANQSAQFRAAVAFIDRHLRNPELSASMVSSALGISTRQLSRIFANQELSVPRLILAKRLELAKRALLSANSDQMFVTNVATFAGFSSHSHFSRAFKEFHGFSPSELRRKDLV
ncbi:MAG: hypothetical protein RLZ28_562 [Actinomycetota bacterium]|jgi:AraC-like DNA-binding protein